MTDVLRGHQQQCRKNGQHRLHVESGGLKIGQGEKGCFTYRAEVQYTQNRRGNISGNDSYQNRDYGKKAPKQDLSEHSNPQGNEKYCHIPRIHFLCQQSRGIRRVSRQLQSNQRHHRPHGRGGKHDINPVRAAFLYDQGHDHAADTQHHKTAQRVLVAEFVNHQQSRRQEREAGAQICRGFSLRNQNKQQRSHTIHQKHHRRVDAEHKRHQHRRAEHGEHMLHTQRHQQLHRHTLLHLDQSFFHVFIPPHAVKLRNRILRFHRYDACRQRRMDEQMLPFTLFRHAISKKRKGSVPFRLSYHAPGGCARIFYYQSAPNCSNVMTSIYFLLFLPVPAGIDTGFLSHTA